MQRVWGVPTMESLRCEESLCGRTIISTYVDYIEMICESWKYTRGGTEIPVDMLDRCICMCEKCCYVAKLVNTAGIRYCGRASEPGLFHGSRAL